MSVKIRIIGNQQTNEYQDAIFFKELLEKEFINTSVTGEILIICNATLFGQDVKDVDLIVIGKLDKCQIVIKTKATTSKTKKKIFEQELEQIKERNLIIKYFCFVIETKRQRVEDIQLEGLTLFIKYNGRLKDITFQSEKQKYALLDFFRDKIENPPYICNFIWLRNVSGNSIKELLGDYPDAFNKHNYLPNTFGLRWLFSLACIQSAPYNPINKETNQLEKYCRFNSFYQNKMPNFDKFSEVFDLFTKAKKVMGDLTRKKIEQITKKLLDKQKYAQAIGEKLVIISGRAGTGKTIKLLHIAYDLAVNQGARCLILTYNNALVSDIKRILAFSEMPDGVDTYSVHISTLHKFFYDVLCGFEIGTSKSINDKIFIDNFTRKGKYESLLKEFYEYIEKKVVEKQDLEKIMKTRHQQIAWDYVFIDEAQDWTDIEKELIYFIFGKERTIIADGYDQLIRSQKKCIWEQGLKKDDFNKPPPEKKGLRQKYNLVNFVKQVAEKMYVYWDVEPKDDFIGGKVIIKTGDFTKELYDSEFKICKNYGNVAYDMIFFTPPSHVLKEQKIDRFGNKKSVGSFRLLQEFADKGIKIWDGTNTDSFSIYSSDLESHRLFQYDSCRGLEGWTVVCLELDEFIRYKFEAFKEENIPAEQNRLESFDDKRDRFVNLWTLIPLTRAIDTLIITLKNPESKIAKVLKDIYQNNPDYIEWGG